jgi:hypothetical protein
VFFVKQNIRDSKDFRRATIRVNLRYFAYLDSDMTVMNPLWGINYQLENTPTEGVSQYLESLDADERIAEWQAKQAADAVILEVRSPRREQMITT